MPINVEMDPYHIVKHVLREEQQSLRRLEIRMPWLFGDMVATIHRGFTPAQDTKCEMELDRAFLCRAARAMWPAVQVHARGGGRDAVPR